MVYFGETGPSCPGCGRSPHGDQPCQTERGECCDRLGGARDVQEMKRSYAIVGAVASAPLWVLFGVWMADLGNTSTVAVAILLGVALVVYVSADLVSMFVTARHRDGVKVCDLVDEIRRMPS